MDAILEAGIGYLAKDDPDIASLIAPRREEAAGLLARYIAEIELHNPALGLVGTRDHQELVVKHILDSLAPLGIIRRLLAKQEQAACETLKIADVGSGAGLPGIPLAIALPHINFTLIERMGRRANFLRNTQTALSLPNLNIVEEEMEKTGPKPAMAGRFALVTFRAFRPLEPKILKGLFRFCGKGGMLAAYKGRREKIEAEMAAAEKAAPNLAGRWQAIPCPVPFLEGERHLLIIQPPTGRNSSKI
jgi:16S rRNA (guanine527-N7)-methyltransferase